MDSIWNTENYVSLVTRQEFETGEWLGADVLADPIEGDYDPDIDWDEEAAIYAAENAYDRYVYGD